MQIYVAAKAYTTLGPHNKALLEEFIEQARSNPAILSTNSHKIGEGGLGSVYISRTKDFYVKFTISHDNSRLTIFSAHRLKQQEEEIISISYTTETNLVSPLLDEPYFNIIRQELEKYSSLENKYDEKIDLILSIMNKMWREKHHKVYVSDLFRVTEKFEDLLLWLGVRDHFVHQFESFLVGSFILLKGKEIFSKVILKDTPSFKHYDDVFFTWLLTSSVHDFGYPASKAKTLNKRLEELFEKLDFTDLSTLYGKLSTEVNSLNLQKLQVMSDDYEEIHIDIKNILAKHMCEKKLLSTNEKEVRDSLQNALDKLDHGCISALLLVRKVVTSITPNIPWNTYKESDDFQNMIEAAMGILFHTVHYENKLPLNFEHHPMISLMIVVDELQEWGRRSNDDGRLYHLSLDKVVTTDVNVAFYYKPLPLQVGISIDEVTKKMSDDWEKKREIFKKIGAAKGEEDFAIKAILLSPLDNEKHLKTLTVPLCIKES